MIRFVKYSAIGWLGFGLQLTVLTLLSEGGSVHYLVATGLAVESAIVHNFFWHDRYTFKDRDLRASGRLRRLVEFNSTTGLTALVGNVGFMRLFVGLLGLHYLPANVAAVACCALVNFMVSDRLVFVARDERSCAG